MRSAPADAVEVGERAGERVAAVDVGVAVGDQHQDVGVGIDVAHDVAQEVHAARVGPVRVVEQDDDAVASRPRRRGGRRRRRTAGAVRCRDRSTSVAGRRERDERDRARAGRSRRRGARRGRRWRRRRRSRRRGAAARSTVRAARRRARRSDRAPRARPRRGPDGRPPTARRVLPMPGSPARRTVVARSTWARFHASVEPEAFVLAAPRTAARRAWRRSGAGNGADGRRTAADHGTSNTMTGSGRPFSSISPTSTKLSSVRPRARPRTRSSQRIWLPSAESHSRAAVTTGVPWQSPSSHDTSPALEADAHLDASVFAGLAVRAVDLPLDLVGGVHGLGRGAERGEDAVAESLDHGAAVLGDHGARARRRGGGAAGRPRRRRGAPASAVLPTTSVYRIVAVPAPASIKDREPNSHTSGVCRSGRSATVDGVGWSEPYGGAAWMVQRDARRSHDGVLSRWTARLRPRPVGYQDQHVPSDTRETLMRVGHLRLGRVGATNP